MSERVGVIAGIEGPRGFVERRLAGPTFIDAVEEYTLQNPKARELSVILDPVAREFHFESIDSIEFSEDGLHVIGIGRDSDRDTLIRDGRPLITGRNLRVLAKTADFSRMVVFGGRFSQQEKGVGSLALIAGEEVKKVSSERQNLTMLAHSPDLATVVYGFYSPGNGATFCDLFYEGDVDGEITKLLFGVDGNFHDLKGVGSNEDFSQVIWQGKKKVPFFGEETFVYNGEKLLVRGRKVQAFANGDASSWMVFLCRARGLAPYSPAAVVIDGQTVFEAKSAATSFGKVTCTRDLRAIVPLYDYEGNDGRLLIIDADKEISVTPCHGSVDSVDEPDDGTLEAVVSRGGVPYKYTVPAK